MKSTKSKQNLQSTPHFDIAKGSLIGHYHEIFNAWTQESKTFTWYLRISNSLAKLFKPAQPNALSLQLIPIDPKQEGALIEIKRQQANGSRSI